MAVYCAVLPVAGGALPFGAGTLGVIAGSDSKHVVTSWRRTPCWTTPGS
jgi:hypothetical protein